MLCDVVLIDHTDLGPSFVSGNFPGFRWHIEVDGAGCILDCCELDGVLTEMDRIIREITGYSRLEFLQEFIL
jgi:hypothetical protein